MISIHKTLFNSLDKILNKADRLKYDQHFVTHESSDFTRKSRKLSFKDTVSFILSMAGKPNYLIFSITQITPQLPLHLSRHVLKFLHVFFNIFWMNWIKHFHLIIYIRAIILLRSMGLKCKYHLILVIPIRYIKVHRKENFYLLFILMSAMMF